MVSREPDQLGGAASGTLAGAPRFAPHLMYVAARMYYLEDATQAEVADHLGTSRPTVSRLLSEARRLGIVRIEVQAPDEVNDSDVADKLRDLLGLDAVYLSDYPPGAALGASLSGPLSTALRSVGLVAGDVLLVSSGRTTSELSQADLPSMPGVLVVPTIGGQELSDAWYQTNEITRQLAARISGLPVFLHAPALPGPELYEILMKEPSIRRVIELWDSARCAVIGVGAPPLLRQSIPEFVPTDAITLRAAVGDVCSRFYDAAGNGVPFPGVERLVATSLESLPRIPVSIAVAVGQTKVAALVAGARARYFNQLVTDVSTAAAVVASVEQSIAAAAQPTVASNGRAATVAKRGAGLVRS